MKSDNAKELVLNNASIEDFLKDLNSQIQKIKFKHKDKNGVTIDTSTLKMISTENLKKSLEKHLGITWTPNL